MNAVLALDLATQTGWAYSSAGLVTSGSKGFGLKKGEGSGQRFLKFRSWLRDQIEIIKPDLVAYEEVMRWSSGAAAKCYCGLLATMQTECEAKEIPYEGVHVGTIKKAATKNGAASKEQMIQAAKSRGYKPTDDNEADAIHLLHIYLDRFNTPLHNKNDN
jgi:Holliday junction resolvasome RuvABC endonuclease subunit